jgi:hypothetical protein
MKIQKLSILALACVCLAGCKPNPRDMIGASLAEVEARFGVPDNKFETITPSRSQPSGVPVPVLLSAGEAYLHVAYSNLKGRHWNLVFVKPEVFSRIKGKSPGPANWYLLEVNDYDKDLIF